MSVLAGSSGSWPAITCMVKAASSNRELVRSELAEHDGAPRLELGLDHAVLGRDVIDQQLGMTDRADTRRRVDVLQRIGNAVHRPLVDTGFELAIGPLGVGER